MFLSMLLVVLLKPGRTSKGCCCAGGREAAKLKNRRVQAGCWRMNEHQGNRECVKSWPHRKHVCMAVAWQLRSKCLSPDPHTSMAGVCSYAATNLAGACICPSVHLRRSLITPALQPPRLWCWLPKEPKPLHRCRRNVPHGGCGWRRQPVHVTVALPPCSP